jgi:hypothetical protein
MCFPMERAVEKKWDFEGLQCVVTRADIAHPDRHSMHRCGYVRIPAGHPWHNNENICPDVHGGLTFSQIEPCAHEDGIGYWIGFDCHHYGDSGFPRDHKFPEGTHSYLMENDGHYWQLHEVQAETEALARQVKAAA